MTIHANTNFTATAEAALPAYTHSPVSLAFGAMSRALSDHIEAERDLQHSGSWDLACTDWLRDAEVVRQTLIAALAELAALPLQRVEDNPLRNMASVIGALVVSGSAIEALQLEALAVEHEPLLRCHDDHPLAHRVNLLLQNAEQQLISLRTLPDYSDAIEGSYAEIDVDNAIENDPPAPADAFEVPEDITLRAPDSDDDAPVMDL